MFMRRGAAHGESSVIRVLVVEDSPVVREFLVHLLGSDPEIDVIGTAPNGEHAVGAASRVHRENSFGQSNLLEVIGRPI